MWQTKCASATAFNEKLRIHKTDIKTNKIRRGVKNNILNTLNLPIAKRNTCKFNGLNMSLSEKMKDENTEKYLWNFYWQEQLFALTIALRITAKNTVISPDFLVWKFCGKAQFPHSFGRFAQNYAETVPFRKIFTPGNQVKLWYFSQWI